MRPNKNELYLSLLIVLPSALLPLHPSHPPPAQAYRDVLIGSGLLLFGLLCTTHALLDARRMAWPERILAVLWFSTLLFVCFQAGVQIWAFAGR